jgi:hypothetical protein
MMESQKVKKIDMFGIVSEYKTITDETFYRFLYAQE